MNKKYFVIKNNAEHSAHVISVDMDDIWSNGNRDGWTYQEISGAHGWADGPYDTNSEATAECKEWFKCDAADRGDYCYTHNPNGRR